jgi:hypothetical protein
MFSSKKNISLVEDALQETLSSKTVTDKGFSHDLIQIALQDSLLANNLTVEGIVDLFD